MDVSIIIVNYHSADLVIDSVKSIYEKTQDISFEVIVVDNASTDDSVVTLKNVLGSQISLIESERNLGFGKANNLGVKHAKGEYIFLLNPDTVLMNNAVKVLHDYIIEHPEVGVAGGNLYTKDGQPNPSFCRNFDSLESEKKNASWSHIIKKKITDKKKQNLDNTLSEFNYTEEPQQVAYIFGADMMMSKQLFEEIKGFDPDFFMYGEEEELTWRITQRGYSVISVPQAKIIHLEGGTTSAENTFSERQFRMRMNGTMTYYRKRYGDNGVHQFYRYRKSRYDRLAQFARIRGKQTTNITGRLLDEEYQNFLKENNL